MSICCFNRKKFDFRMDSCNLIITITCYGVGETGGKSRVARHVRAASPRVFVD
jgi:hypothetical protein